MPPSTWAGIIAAIGTMLTAVALVITAWTNHRNTRRVECKVEEVQKTGQEVHKIVNQERTDRLNYQAALIRALEAKGIDVPVDQSAVAPPQADR